MPTSEKRVVILGAAGRDFHDFNTVFRDDPETRVVAFTATQIPGIAGRYLGSLLANPLRAFRRLHLQSIMMIQPVDFLENGAQNMCDGCPDMTLWNGELVWSCRMEELKQFGGWVRTVPRPGDRE